MDKREQMYFEAMTERFEKIERRLDDLEKHDTESLLDREARIRKKLANSEKGEYSW